MKYAQTSNTKMNAVKAIEEAARLPVEILKKLRTLTHLRRREVKRMRRWAFFDL